MPAVKMATQISVGDLVEYHNVICTVVEKQNPLRFNTFSLLNLDNGMYHHNVMRQVIGLDPAPGLNLFDDIDLDLGQDLQFANTKLQAQAAIPSGDAATYSVPTPLPAAKIEAEPHSPPQESKKPRFKQVSQAMVDQLADATTSTSTKQQTKWAVKIFTGG